MLGGVALRAFSHHSLGRGVPSPEELVDGAAALGLRAVAMADENTMAGVVDFVAAARERGVQPVPAATLEAAEGALVLLPRDPGGWAALCRLLTARHLGEGSVSAMAAFEEMEGRGFLLATTAEALEALPDNHPDVLACVPWPQGSTAPTVVRMRAAARKRRVPAVAAPAVRFVAESDAITLRFLAAIHARRSVYDRLPSRPSRTACFRSPAEMRTSYLPRELTAAAEVASACQWCFPKGDPPRLPSTGRARPDRDLATRCLGALRSRGLARRRPYVQRLAHELRLIRAHGFSDYFLLVAEIADASRRAGIPTLGRGSAAGSAVAWLLGITQVDPVEHGLLFERFLNSGRVDPPDFDLDFPSDARLTMIQKAIRQFGEERCAAISTHVAFRPRSAFNETALAMGYDEKLARKVGRMLPQRIDGTLRASLERIPGGRETLKRLLEFPGVWGVAKRLVGKPRHLGSHPGGVVIAREPVTNLVALQKSALGPPITQPEMTQVEKGLGLLKVDLLGNRSLGVLRDASKWVGVDWRDLMARCHLDPTPKMKRRLALGNTLGVFYIESPAMRGLLRQLRPQDFDELMVASSVIRPGVAYSGMKDAYIRRRRGLEEARYPHPVLRALLHKTLGVMVYQEDVMRMARHLGGLGWAEANELRKASSTKRGRFADVGDSMAVRFRRHAERMGCSPADTRELWRQIASFAGYAFCKAHSASYAQESMACLWMAAHEPAAFWAAVLAVGGGYYGTSAYMEEARRQGVHILGCHLNLSARNWRAERTKPHGPLNAIRPGLQQIKMLRRTTVDAITTKRPFVGVADLLARVPMRREEGVRLVEAGALDFTKEARATILRRMLSASDGDGAATLLDNRNETPPPIVPWTFADAVLRERAALGCSPTAPPISLVLPGPPRRTPIRALPGRIGHSVRIVGHFVTARNHRTARGDPMRFMTVEDETGMVECLVWPRAMSRLYGTLRGRGFWALKGVPRRDYDAISFEVKGAERLHPLPPEVATRLPCTMWADDR